MNARTSAGKSVCLHSQSPPRKLCVDDESLDSLGWCALVPSLPKVPRIRVGDDSDNESVGSFDRYDGCFHSSDGDDGGGCGGGGGRNEGVGVYDIYVDDADGDGVVGGLFFT